MMHLVMAERRQFLIGGVGTALARASFIRIPADSRASGRLCRVFLNVVIQRGDFLFGGVGTTLARASFIRIPAYLKAGGRLRIVVYLVVVERRQFPIGSIAAPGAGVVRVPALFSAGGRFGGTLGFRSWLLGSISPVCSLHTVQVAFATQVAVLNLCSPKGPNLTPQRPHLTCFLQVGSSLGSLQWFSHMIS